MTMAPPRPKWHSPAGLDTTTLPPAQCWHQSNTSEIDEGSSEVGSTEQVWCDASGLSQTHEGTFRTGAIPHGSGACRVNITQSKQLQSCSVDSQRHEETFRTQRQSSCEQTDSCDCHFSVLHTRTCLITILKKKTWVGASRLCLVNILAHSHHIGELPWRWRKLWNMSGKKMDDAIEILSAVGEAKFEPCLSTCSSDRRMKAVTATRRVRARSQPRLGNQSI